MRNSTIAQRQNDARAIELIKASHRCFRAERIIKYIMIFLSFGVCLAAIFNRYLPQMAPHIVDIEKIQQDASTYLNLISGAIIVAGMPLGFYSTRMHTEGTVLQDRYEAYVFDNQSNRSILRPISDTYIALYAKKAGKDDTKFRNRIYGDTIPEDEATAQFEFIKKEAHSDYNLYVSIQPFFMTIWVGFCILVIIIAVSFNDMFVTTLINIMIPSLSAITTIGNSWFACRLQMKQLTNLINCIDRIESLPPDLFKKYITDKEKMRLLADGLFNYRSSAFVIPNFLVKSYQKSVERNKLATIAKTNGETDKTAEKAVTSSTAATKAPSAPVAKTAPAAKPANGSTAKNTAVTPAKANGSAGKSLDGAKNEKPAGKSAAAKSAPPAQTARKEDKAKTAANKPTAKAEKQTTKQPAKAKDGTAKQPAVKTAKTPSAKSDKPSTQKKATANKKN